MLQAYYLTPATGQTRAESVAGMCGGGAQGRPRVLRAKWMPLIDSWKVMRVLACVQG